MTGPATWSVLLLTVLLYHTRVVCQPLLAIALPHGLPAIPCRPHTTPHHTIHHGMHTILRAHTPACTPVCTAMHSTSSSSSAHTYHYVLLCLCCTHAHTVAHTARECNTQHSTALGHGTPLHSVAQRTAQHTQQCVHGYAPACIQHASSCTGVHCYVIVPGDVPPGGRTSTDRYRVRRAQYGLKMRFVPLLGHSYALCVYGYACMVFVFMQVMYTNTVTVVTLVYGILIQRPRYIWEHPQGCE